jgi:ribosomal protein L17
MEKDYFQEIISLVHEANDAFKEGRIITAIKKAQEIKRLANALVVSLDDYRLNTPPEIMRDIIRKETEAI